tara:strand:- start:284 stop:511 length:228 start_codon:yes stop_codon:yes gene_type:complete
MNKLPTVVYKNRESAPTINSQFGTAKIHLVDFNDFLFDGSIGVAVQYTPDDEPDSLFVGYWNFDYIAKVIFGDNI